MTFFGYRLDGEILAVGALKDLDGHRAELRSMHSADQARRRGIARSMVERLIGVVRDRGFAR